MKKSLSLLLLSFLLAQGVFATGQQEPEKGEGPIVITVPHYKMGQNVGGKFFLPQVERFNQEYDGIYKLVLEEVPQDAYADRLKQLGQQNLLPALMEGGHKEWMEQYIIPNKLYLDLSGWLKDHPEVSNLSVKESLNFLTQADGTVATLPQAVVRPIALFYNSSMIDFGKPVGEMSIDEFGKALGDNKMAFMTAENAWTTTLFFTSIFAGEEGGREILKAGTIPGNSITDYTTEIWIKSFEKLKYFLQNHASSNTLGAAYADAANSFMSKSSAVIANGPWMIGDFLPGSSDKWSNGFNGDQVHADMYPGNIAIANMDGYYWWIPASTPEREQEAALAFLAFVNSPAEIEAFILAEGGNSPNLAKSEKFKSELAKNRIMSELDEAVNGETVFTVSVGDAMPAIVANNEWGKLLPKLIDGALTPLQFGEILSKKAIDAME